MSTKNYKSGDKIEILCHNSLDDKSTWQPGIFNRKVSATDRDFRINCTLDNGKEISEAAPECVRRAMSNSIKLLSDIVLHPRKYDHVVGVPGMFDAAEALYKSHYDEINTKVLSAVRSILLKSGKYKVASAIPA